MQILFILFKIVSNLLHICLTKSQHRDNDEQNCECLHNRQESVNIKNRYPILLITEISQMKM